MQQNIKMRVMYSTNKKKVQTFATAIGEAFKCLVNDVPPAFPCEKERLVIIGMTLKGDPSDKLRLFCRELTPARALNVALFVDGEKDCRGLQIIRDVLKEAGTNVIDNVYYVNGGGALNLSAKISLEERTNIVKWVEGIVAAL